MPVRHIEFKGLEHTSPAVVRRELLHRQGGLYSDSLWRQEKRRLQGLDLFAEVEAVCADSTLTYRFTELFQFFPAPAGKKTDQDGWMLGGALAHLNLGGRDVRVEGQLRTSVRPLFDAKEYALYASSPWLWDWPLDWNLELVRTDSWDGLRGFQDKSWAGWTDVGWPLGGHWSLLANAGARRYDGRSWTPGLGGGLLWDSRDAPLDARSGFYGEGRYTRYKGAGNDYGELLADLRSYTSLGSQVLLLDGLMRFRPGTQDFRERLHQGGANTLRGFDPDSALHGRHEILLNAEARRILVDRKRLSFGDVHAFWGLQAVAGVDGAFLWDETRPDWEHYRSAAYAGLHLVIPALDRLRFELGYSPEARDWVVAVGLFEKNITQRWRSR